MKKTKEEIVEGFDIFLEISKIQTYITQSNEEKLKKKVCKKIIELRVQHF